MLSLVLGRRGEDPLHSVEEATPVVRGEAVPNVYHPMR